MGEGYIIKCKHCCFEKEILLGVGMQYFRLQNVYGSLPLKFRKEIDRIMTFSDAVVKECSESLFVCSNCDALYNELYVEIHYGAGETFRTVFKCKKCRHELTYLGDNPDFVQIKCPDCRHTSLDPLMTIIWD